MKLVTRKLFNGECMKKRITLIVFSMLIIVALYVLYCFNYIPHKKYTNADFNIEAYKSNIDKDNDGIDDQTDILNNANNYIKTNPKYKSKYYNTGYPDDEYGVCTDVVAFALKDAGYDLMVLVNEDIKNNKELYDIDAVDKNIDFRRVKNLKVYFDNNAISLTTDINEIEEWQALYSQLWQLLSVAPKSPPLCQFSLLLYYQIFCIPLCFLRNFQLLHLKKRNFTIIVFCFFQ